MQKDKPARPSSKRIPARRSASPCGARLERGGGRHYLSLGPIALRGAYAMRLFNRGPTVPVLRFSGPIGMVTPLRPGLALSSVAGAIERAFAASKLPTVAVVVNSPGG